MSTADLVLCHRTPELGHNISVFEIFNHVFPPRFDQLFEEGMTASAAWHCQREEIREQNPEIFHLLLGILVIIVILNSSS